MRLRSSARAGGCGRRSRAATTIRRYGLSPVIAIYDITMSFDPDGSVPGVDILERIDEGDITPRLTIYRTNDEFQLAYNTPEDPPRIASSRKVRDHRGRRSVRFSGTKPGSSLR